MKKRVYPDHKALAYGLLQAYDVVGLLRELVRLFGLKIIVSLSGGKDSVAQLLELIELFGRDAILCHHQVLPLDWSQTIPYNQELCHTLDVDLICQQVIYEVKPGTERGVQRREIRTIASYADVVPFGTGKAIACTTDFAERRGWPPSPAARFCTGKFKTRLLDAWAAGNRQPLGEEMVIADPTDLAMRRGWPPSPAARFCLSYFKRDLLNGWASGDRRAGRLGNLNIVALGERAAESPRRAKKTPLHFRGKPRQSYSFLNWLPVYSWSRRQCFRKLREWGIEPHPAYRIQGMSNRDMYDKDEEGGPRMGCVGCIYARDGEVCAQMADESNLPRLLRIAQIEQATGKDWWYQKGPGGVNRRRSATEILESILRENSRLS